MGFPDRVQAAVVVGLRASELDDVVARARSVGARQCQRLTVGPDRLVLGLDHRDPVGLVRTLRSAGLAAVAGPTTAGHAVAWARRNAPVPFGAGAAVCFPWSVFDRSRFDPVVEIDPGSGFGSGEHPTTRLLLDRLAALPLAGRRVLDVGSGSGVLSVAAAMLGADSVTALDIAPAAVAATIANAARNDVGDVIEVVDADLAQLTDPFDVVVANIGAQVLVELAPDLARLTAPGGLLALSGLSPAQPSMVVAALPSMVLAWADERSDWVAVGCRSTSPSAPGAGPRA